MEYATDLAFRSTATLGPLYEQLVRQSVLDVKAEHVASFLGRQITPLLAQEIGSQFATRIEGTCIKHRFGKCSIKMYDKHGIVLRIETTTNDVSFFKHHRKVEHRQGPPTREVAPVKKTIYSLIDLREILLGCNRRYLAHLSALDDFSAGVRSLGRLTKPREVEGRTVKGLNFFAPDEQALLHAIQDPKGNIAGFRRGDLLADLTRFSPTRLSRQLRRLLDLGVVKRVAGTYRYYLTKAGRAATAAATRLTEATIVPVTDLMGFLPARDSTYWVRTQDRKHRIQARLARGHALTAEDQEWIDKARKPGIRQLFLPDLRRNTLMATFVASMALVSYSTVGYWMPLFLVQQHGWTTAEYGSFYIWWALFSTLGFWLGGWMIDRLGRRLGFGILLLEAAFFLTIWIFAEGKVALWLLGMAWSFGFIGVWGPVTAYTAEMYQLAHAASATDFPGPWRSSSALCFGRLFQCGYATSPAPSSLRFC